MSNIPPQIRLPNDPAFIQALRLIEVFPETLVVILPGFPTSAMFEIGKRMGLDWNYHTNLTDLVASYIVRPDPVDPLLSREVEGVDQTGARITTRVVTEKALTLYLNAQEIVTMMTIGDHPAYLGIGYLLNQMMLRPDDELTGADFDGELDVIVVRTKRRTDYEGKINFRRSHGGDRGRGTPDAPPGSTN